MSTTEPYDTCSDCGARIYNDGDLAMRLSSGALICVVCFLDPVRSRQVVEQAGFDMKYWDKIAAHNRTVFDQFRGREIQRRTKRDADPEKD